MKRLFDNPRFTYILLSIIVLNIVFLIVVTAYLISNSKAKIAYVDAMRILKEYHGVVKVKDQLELETKTWRLNLDTLQSEIDAEIKMYSLERKSLSSSVRSQREHTIDDKKSKYFEYRKTIEELSRKKEKELLDRILVTLNQRVKKYAEENDLDVILSAGPQGNIAYVRENLDITGEMLELLNSEFDLKN